MVGAHRRAGAAAAHVAQWGAEFASLSRRRLRLSRGSRRVLPGEPLAGGCAGGAGDARERSGALAWDLFAGVGLFARRLAASFARVVAVESAPAATQALDRQSVREPVATAVRAATLDFLRRANASASRLAPILIVVDPPRTGLGAETCALLGRGCARRRWSMSPATRRRWPATCAHWSARATRSNPSLWPTCFRRPFIWKQWSSCGAPDRLDGQSFF